LLEDGNKASALLSYLLPPTGHALDKHSPSLLARTIDPFVTGLYAAALQRGYGVEGARSVEYPDGIPRFDNTAELLKLAKQLGLSDKNLWPMWTARASDERTYLTQKVLHGLKLDAFAVTVMHELHEAAIETIQKPVWRPKNLFDDTLGDPITHLKYVTKSGSSQARLPLAAFDEQVTAPNHLGNGCRVLVGKDYLYLGGDEVQDDSVAKFLLRNKIAREMKALQDGVAPAIGLSGDSDQSVNFCNHASADAGAEIRFQYPTVTERTKPETLRCPSLHVTFATSRLNAAREEYELAKRTKPDMRAAVGAKVGNLQHDVTFKSHPPKPTVDTAVLCRRGMAELRDVFLLLIALGSAVTFHANSRIVTALPGMRKMLKAVANHAQPTPTAEAIIDLLNSPDFASSSEHKPYALGLVAALRSSGTSSALDLMVYKDVEHFVEQRYSDEKCQKLMCQTAHASKGETYQCVYILAYELFPLEQAANDGKIALEQEANIEYVALTRSTDELLFLQTVERGESIASVLFDM
jgi:hypothetical protein